MNQQHTIRTAIWEEQAEPDNAFATRAAYCHGYDVYGEMLGNAGWVDMLYLLVKGEAPSRSRAAAIRPATRISSIVSAGMRMMSAAPSSSWLPAASRSSSCSWVRWTCLRQGTGLF